MTASALTRPGERDRISTKITEIEWRLVGLLCIIASVGAAMLYSITGGHWQPWAADHLIRFGAMLVVMLCLAMVHPKWWFRGEQNRRSDRYARTEAQVPQKVR